MDCGIVRSNLVPSQEEMNKFYSSNLYRFIYESSDLAEYFDRKIKFALSGESLILKSLEPYLKNKEISVLEIGCAGGWNLLEFKESGYHDLTGYEPGSFYREMGKKKLNLDLRNGFLEDALEDEKKYDVILLNHVLEHILDPLDALHKIYDLLKDDGLLYLGVPNIQEYDIGQIQNAHYLYFSPLNFSKLINTANFKVLKFSEDNIHMYFISQKNKINSFKKENLINTDKLLKLERELILFKAITYPFKRIILKLKRILSMLS